VKFIIKLFYKFINVGHWLLAKLNNFRKWLLKRFWWLVGSLIPLLIVWYGIGVLTDWWEFRDQHPTRGVASITDDPFDAPVEAEDIHYLKEQGWKEKDSLWFYQASQGSNLLPYDFFLFLKQRDNDELFRSDKNINRYRYLPQVKTTSNPHALPVGMSKDVYQGKEFLGFTCAACHTSQINALKPGSKDEYLGIRVDGGPAAGDLETFLKDMASALESMHSAKQANPTRYQAFVDDVIEHEQATGFYDSESQIFDDLARYANRIRSYVRVNDPLWAEGSGKTHYGFSRLDAFGRIYNRVLQYLVDIETLNQAFSASYPKEVIARAKPELKKIENTQDKTNLFLRYLTIVESNLDQFEQGKDIYFNKLRSHLFNSANAPVSIPYLWDIPYHDYVQWTGLVSNAGVGPLGRNVGQVIGVFGNLDWQKKKGWSINTFLGGQGLGPSYVDFKSSINKRNLRRVETHLKKLSSPKWPEDLIGELDKDMIEKGKPIFDQYCSSCHTHLKNPTSTSRKIVVRMSKLDSVQTDPVLASNTVNYLGKSGLIEGRYVDAGQGKLVMENESPVASLVKFSTQNVVLAWDPDVNPIRRAAEWAYDIVKTFTDNKIKPSLKRGDYEPATTLDPFLPLKSYKARPLNGIWATAPYLHNGSVPNLYELLLPKKRANNPEFDEFGNPIEYRSDSFIVGSRELDTAKVGFKDKGYSGFVFDTTLPGNSNQGHEYAAGKTAQLNGNTLPALTKQQRQYLLEYLKSI